MRVLMRDGRSGVDSAFAELPRQVYADDPLWIPEEEASLHSAFDVANPWFAHGRALTLCVPGEARLAVFRDDGCTIDGRPAAYFGYWEQYGTGTASARLFAEAEAWARLHGATLLCGPVNFTTLGTYRLRTAAEPDAVPFPNEPYNPGSYPEALRALGFGMTRGFLTHVGPIKPELLAAKLERRRAVVEAGYVLTALTGEDWMAMLPELHRAADEIFGEGLGYTPVSLDAFSAACGLPIAKRFSPHASVVARAPDGSLAGFVLTYPHYGPLAVQRAGSRRVPASELTFDSHAPILERLGQRTAVMKTVGVAKAHRQRGVMDALVVTSIERGMPTYDRWLAAMIRDDNPSANFGRPHAEHQRRYALYGKVLDVQRAA